MVKRRIKKKRVKFKYKIPYENLLGINALKMGNRYKLPEPDPKTLNQDATKKSLLVVHSSDSLVSSNTQIV